jgi:hypothetical protein
MVRASYADSDKPQAVLRLDAPSQTGVCRSEEVLCERQLFPPPFQPLPVPHNGIASGMSATEGIGRIDEPGARDQLSQDEDRWDAGRTTRDQRLPGVEAT